MSEKRGWTLEEFLNMSELELKEWWEVHEEIEQFRSDKFEQRLSEIKRKKGRD